MIPDCAIITGTRCRYACRTVAEVDAHLAGLIAWLAKTLPKMHTGARRVAQISFARDIDRLLNARAMLASLDTLDEDLAELASM